MIIYLYKLYHLYTHIGNKEYNIDMKKYLEILSSVRFQQLAIAAILVGLKIYQSTDDIKNAVITAVIALLTASTTVGTVDKIGTSKIAAAKIAAKLPAKKK